MRRKGLAAAARVVNVVGGYPVLLSGGSRARVDLRSRHVARTQEPWMLARVLRELRGSREFIDAGAHWGTYALLAARNVGHVHAFEPVAESAAMLRRNLRLSRLANVTVHETALDAHAGTVELSVDPSPTWAPAMIASLAPRSGEQLRPVRATTLDDERLHPDVIKLDVEGAELRVLQGSSRTLALRPVLLIEVHERALATLGGEVADLRALLSDAKYAIEEFAVIDLLDSELLRYWLARPLRPARAGSPPA